MSPKIWVPMEVPVLCGFGNRFFDLLPSLKSSSSQGERAKGLPPRLDEVEIGGSCRNVGELPARVREQEQQHLFGSVDVEVIQNTDDLGWARTDPGVDQFEEGKMVGLGATLIGLGIGFACMRVEGTEDMAAPPPTVVGLVRSSTARML